MHLNCLKTRLPIQNINWKQFRLKTIPNNWKYIFLYIFLPQYFLPSSLPFFLSLLSFLVELCHQKAYVKSQQLYLLMWPYLDIESFQMDLVKMRAYWIKVILKSNMTMSL